MFERSKTVGRKIKSVIQFHHLHESPDSLKYGTKGLVEGLLTDEEEFIVAANCKDEPNIVLFFSWATTLVLTDQRVIACQMNLLNDWSESYQLDGIHTVEIEKEWTGDEITIKGSGEIDESFEFYRWNSEESMAERFASELRAQL